MLIYECWQTGRPRGACRGWPAERGSAATVGSGRLWSCVSDQLRGRAVLRRQGLATRLSAEPSRRVLLLEAGPNFAPNAYPPGAHQRQHRRRLTRLRLGLSHRRRSAPWPQHRSAAGPSDRRQLGCRRRRGDAGPAGRFRPLGQERNRGLVVGRSARSLRNSTRSAICGPDHTAATAFRRSAKASARAKNGSARDTD